MSTPTATQIPPQHIYIIRHGEKPDVPNQPPFGITVEGQECIDSLLPRGWQRAGALARLFDPAKGKLLKGLYRPTQLFSPFYGSPSGAAPHRTYQTIFPLSQRLAIATQTVQPVGNEAKMITTVLNTSTPTVLICWEHDHIPHLANGIPVPSGTLIPQKWPSERFDVIWKFDLIPGSAPPSYRFSQIPQQLLVGDVPTVIPVTQSGHKPKSTKGHGLG